MIAKIKKIIKIRNQVISLFGLFIIFVLNIALAIEDNKQHNNLAENGYHKYALIRGLNKITGKSLILKIPVGDELHYFEKLGIFVRKCWKDNEESLPESKVLIEVWHKDSNGDIERIFFGWLLSLNSSVSAIEHPMYDLSLVECIN
jgi:hypothetical protein